MDGAVNDLRHLRRREPRSDRTTFDHLNAITTALNDSRRDIKQTLHVAPTVFQNFLNIYQPAQSAVTGILALINFADIRPIHLRFNRVRRPCGAKRVRLCEQYLSPIIKNRKYNYLPLGLNPFVGASARPNEITYSEDKLNPTTRRRPARRPRARPPAPPPRRLTPAGGPTAGADRHPVDRAARGTRRRCCGT